MENAQPESGLRVPRRMLTGIVLHWGAGCVAIRLVHPFVGTGRMAQVDTGLACGLIPAPACATAGVTLSEEYVWLPFLPAILAGVGLCFGARLPERNRGRATAGA